MGSTVNRKEITKRRLQEADTRSLVNRKHKHQANFFGHVITIEKLEHLVQGVQHHLNIKFPTFSKNFLPRILKENPKSFSTAWG